MSTTGNFTTADIVAFPNSKTAKAVFEGRSRFVSQIGTVVTEVEDISSTAIIGASASNTGNKITSVGVVGIGGASASNTGNKITSVGVVGIGGGSTIATTTDTLTVTAIGQTGFSLSGTPTNAAASVLEVNTVAYTYGTDYTISGSTVTLSGSFNLAPTDLVKVTWY